MILSVIVPQYKETDDTISKLLYSINYQVSVDWNEVEVLIVNDHSDVKLSDKLLNGFTNIKPKYIELPKNVGPGLCRQAGLDAAQGEYVTFCDADDIYQNFGVFSLYFENISNYSPDIIQTQWLEELQIDKESRRMGYLTHTFETTWMHGKVFKKKYLTDNNIRFSNNLRYHEDSYFLSNAFEMTTNILQIPSITYIWSYDNNSITRRNNGAFAYESVPEFIRAVEESIDWLKDKVPDKIPRRVTQVFLYVYYLIQSNPAWRKEDVLPIEKELARVMLKYDREFNSCDVQTFSTLDCDERMKVKMHPYIQTETFSNFCNRIVNTYIKEHSFKEEE